MSQDAGYDGRHRYLWVRTMQQNRYRGLEGIEGAPSRAMFDEPTVIRFLCVFWSAFVVLYSLRALLLGAPLQFDVLPRRLVVAAAGGLISWLIYRVLRAQTGTPQRQLILVAALSLPAGLAFSLVNSGVFYLYAPSSGETCFSGLPCTADYMIAVTTEYAINWSFIFVAMGMLFSWSSVTAQAIEADRLAAVNREAARLAEIRALQYQMNPHFLFNCLNSLSTLVARPDRADAQDMIEDMAKFLRLGLTTDPTADNELMNEVEMQRRYLALEQRRFSHLMSFEIDVPEDVGRARVPPLMLQPLVENAIKHGVSQSSSPVRITIRARATSDQVMLTVEDNASRLHQASGQNAAPGFGIGLRNVADRLAAMFPEDTASLATERLNGGGFRVSLTFPKRNPA